MISQTVTPIEIILVYDNSEDNTLSIINEKEVQNKNIVKVIKLKENKGISFARNYGVERSTGEYILFMDSDDIAELDLIGSYIKRIEELKNDTGDNYILCYSAYIQIDEKDDIISGISRGMQFKPLEALGYEFLRNYIMSTSGVLVNREIFIESGGFNEKIIYSEDWDLWLRLATIGGFAYVDKPLVKIRRHGENMSSRVATMLNAEKNILKQYDMEYIKEAIFKRNLEIEYNTVDYISLLYRLDCWEEGLLELERLYKEGYGFYNLFFYLGLYYLKTNDYKKSLDYFKKTIEQKDNHGAALNNMGALLLLDGKKEEARRSFEQAIKFFPNYMDASNNYEFLDKENVLLEELKFTWRELREVLTSYIG